MSESQSVWQSLRADCWRSTELQGSDAEERVSSRRLQRLEPLAELRSHSKDTSIFDMYSNIFICIHVKNVNHVSLFLFVN